MAKEVDDTEQLTPSSLAEAVATTLARLVDPEDSPAVIPSVYVQVMDGRGVLLGKAEVNDAEHEPFEAGTVWESLENPLGLYGSGFHVEGSRFSAFIAEEDFIVGASGKQACFIAKMSGDLVVIALASDASGKRWRRAQQMALSLRTDAYDAFCALRGRLPAEAAVASNLWMWGDTPTGTDYLLSPTSKSWLPQKRVKQLACGEKHLLLLTDDGLVFSCGDCNHGVLGRGDSMVPSSVPLPVDTLAAWEVSSISCGKAHCAALTATGDLFTWGSRRLGRLGLSDVITGHVATPTFVQALERQRIVSMSAGDAHTVALCEDGKLFGWGFCASGRLPGLAVYDGPDHVTMPTEMPPVVEEPVKVVCGDAVTAIIDSDGKLWAAGHNVLHRLGLPGADHCFHSFTPVKLDEPVVSVSYGLKHAVARTREGHVWVWGDNRHGQCGQNRRSTDRDYWTYRSKNIVTEPTRLHMPPTTSAERRELMRGVADDRRAERPPVRAMQVLAGRGHTLLLTAEGDLYVCGSNALGQLGVGSTESLPILTPVLGFSSPELAGALSDVAPAAARAAGDAREAEAGKEDEEDGDGDGDGGCRHLVHIAAAGCYSMGITDYLRSRLAGAIGTLITAEESMDVVWQLKDGDTLRVHGAVAASQMMMCNPAWEMKAAEWDMPISLAAAKMLRTFLYTSGLLVSQSTAATAELLSDDLPFDLPPRLISILTNHPVETSQLERALGTIVCSPLYSDITLVLDDGARLPAHKCLLVVRSEYFKSMFEGGLAEASAKEVHLAGMSQDAVTVLLRFLYTGEVTSEHEGEDGKEEELSPDVALELMGITNMLNMPELKNVCASAVCKVVDVENVLGAYVMAGMYDSELLRSVCLRLIGNNAKEALRSDPETAGAMSEADAAALLEVVAIFGISRNDDGTWSGVDDVAAEE
eukprot:PLAT8430.2.p1 GENE.PLAT8430.2~~PLAT8430.2.p1  ORF type:complete len:949 (-),score=328.86 PLAT8430.2:60-2840(-)